MKHKYLCAFACVCLPLLADDATRPNFSGNWRLDPTKSEVHSKVPAEWTIQQDEESIAIGPVKCATNGRDCPTKEDGEPASISFYYNGPILVEMDLLGHNKDHVIKKRLKMGEDGKTMEVEILHINPQSAAEKLVFAKE